MKQAMLLTCGQLRKLHTKFPTVMSAWQVLDYKESPDTLILNRNVRVPVLKKPSDVLIAVNAASLNPIDAGMRLGYGRTYLNTMRYAFGDSADLPIILGRDCSGTVVDVGQGVKKFRRGDEVYAAIGAQRPWGTLAEYALAAEDSVALKPKSLSFTDAASIPYVACTVYAAVCRVGRLGPDNAKHNRVLIHAGGGGIGSFAVQLLKAWGAHVVTTCSAENTAFVQTFQPDAIIDYNAPDAYERLADAGPYDLILDPIGSAAADPTRAMNLLRIWKNSIYVTLSSPLLRNGDDFGFLGGLAKSAFDFGQHFVSNFPSTGRFYAWAYFSPNGHFLSDVAQLIDGGQIKPVVTKVWKFADVPEALATVGKRKGRGKYVVSVR